MKSNQLNRSQN